MFGIDRERRSVTVACFSPNVILITFVSEIALAAYTWWRYKAGPFGRRAAIFLVLLAGFQVSEFMICQGYDYNIWSRTAFISTAFLPIIAIDFIRLLTRKKIPVGFGYTLAGAFSAVFALAPGLFRGAECTGKFVAFNTGNPAFDIAYAIYYLSALVLGIGLAWAGMKKGARQRKALLWLIIGYLSFMIPTFVIYAVSAAFQPGFASMLCGFAVILAFILVIRILPLSEAAIRER